MHNPVAEPRRSIYYPYRVMAPWLPSRHSGPQRAKVVVGGAGPAGLVLALELARHGVPSVVLESERQVSEGSRAIVFTRRTMEILQQVGVASRITAAGLPWCYGNSFYRGQRVFRMENPKSEDDRFYPMINLQQQYLEEYLIDAVTEQSLIELRWGNRVTGVAQREAGVLVTIDTPDGPYELETEWLVAADGARSGIRSLLGLKMEGQSYEGRFVIADIRVDLPLPTERLAFFDPDWNPGNTVLMHREPHGIWRIDYQLPAGQTPETALEPQALHARINAALQTVGYGDRPWELDWASVYSARTLTLPDYVHGRVLFTGDAAHMLPIFGVRGANTAFQDSQSLGWHLAYVVRNILSREALANFSRERVGAAREIIDEAGKSTRFMTPPTRGFRLLRDAVLSLSLSEPFVSPLYHWRTSRPHEYTVSAFNCQGDDNALFQTGPGDGAPPLNVRLGVDDYLLDHIGGAFDLLYYTGGGDVPASLREVIDGARQRGLPIRVLAVGSGHPIAAADVSLSDEDGRLRARYGMESVGAAYLFRPDQHICARWVTLDAARLSSALNHILESRT
mgnify:CR=1 FL=1